MDFLFVSINPIFPAEYPGPFTLPGIAGGSLAPDDPHPLRRRDSTAPVPLAELRVVPAALPILGL
jgi:hypothetical protein